MLCADVVGAAAMHPGTQEWSGKGESGLIVTGDSSPLATTLLGRAASDTLRFDRNARVGQGRDPLSPRFIHPRAAEDLPPMRGLRGTGACPSNRRRGRPGRVVLLAITRCLIRRRGRPALEH